MNATMDERRIAHLLYNEARIGNPAKWLLWLFGLGAIWYLNDQHLPNGTLIGTSLYAVTNLIFTVIFWGCRPTPDNQRSPSGARGHHSQATHLQRGGIESPRSLLEEIRWASVILSYIADFAFISYLIMHTGGLSSDLYLLYPLLVLKSALYYPYFRLMIYVPFLVGPLYVGVLYLDLNGLFFMTDPVFLVRYLLLLGTVLGGLALGWVVERRQRWIRELDRSLGRKSVDLDRQARELQRTARDLGNRVLQLRSLQESIKAINSALALDDLLELIVTNASSVLRGARCAIALLDEKTDEIVTRAASGVPAEELWGSRFKRGQGVAGWVVQHGQPVLIADVDRDDRFIRLGTWPIASMISVPLIADGVPIGTISATSPEPNAFANEDLDLLGAFADQAAMAVKNARLYERLAQEKQETARLYQSVQERRSELEAILWGIGDGVIVTDSNLCLSMLNPIAAQIFSVRGHIGENTHISSVIPNEDLLALFEDTLHNSGAPLTREISLAGGREGTEKVYQALASTIQGDDGKVHGVVTVLRDITSQKELERMKSNFLSVVSHELKTPLHSIRGFIDIILMGRTGPVTETQKDFLETVRAQTDNLRSLIDDLLEFSRLESGQVKLRLEDVSIPSVAQAVVDKLLPLANEKGVRLISTVPADFPLIEADRMRIEQVVTNLVHNAVKFTSQGGSVTIHAVDRGEHVQVSVADTGIGIPPEEQERIFDRFYQVDSSATRAYRGTGLGLTICKHIVEYHGGRIWVESVEGEGSTFHFILPKRMGGGEEMAIDFTTLPPRRGREG